MEARACELCSEQASVYCASDSALLCFHCDARVHQANFLVARHLRQRLCSKCNGLVGDPFSGAGLLNLRSLCSSCSPETEFSGEEDECLSSSLACSACVSSTESFAGKATTKVGFENHRQKSESSDVTEVSSKVSEIPARFSGMFKKRAPARAPTTTRNVDAKAEGTFVNWSNKLGLNGNSTTVVVKSASQALGFCLGRLAGLPLRVSMAGSFWFGLRFCGDRIRSVSTCQNLRRVEEMTGVPAKLIVAVEEKLGRELRVRRARREQLTEEGWAEC